MDFNNFVIKKEDTQAVAYHKFRKCINITSEEYRELTNHPAHVNRLLIEQEACIGETWKLPVQFVGSNKKICKAVAKHLAMCIPVGTQEVYPTYDRRIGYAQDTKLFYKRENLFKTPDGYYLEVGDRRELIFEGESMWYLPEQIVVANDTGNEIPLERAYRGSDGGLYEYRFSVNPDVPWFYNQTEDVTLKERGFGVEFEYKNAIKASQALFKSPLKRYFFTVDDGSIRLGNGCEFVSRPLVPSELNIVEDIIKLFKETDVTCDTSCGTHIHVSAKDYTYKDIVRLSRFCKRVENELFSFVMPHRQASSYCRKLDGRFLFNNPDVKTNIYSYYGSRERYEERPNTSKWAVGSVRHFWLSLDRIFRFREEPDKKTIEFRLFHTVDIEDDPEIYTKHWINLCYGIVEACKKSDPQTLEDCIPYAILPEKLKYFIKNAAGEEE